MSRKPVLITTQHRGVFFGYIEPGTENDDPITVTEKQMCTYYSKAMRGVFGLAVHGPDKDCKIGPPVKEAKIKNITSVVECTDEAAKNWKKEPWAG